MANYCRTYGTISGPDAQLQAIADSLAEVRRKYGGPEDYEKEVYQTDILRYLIERFSDIEPKQLHWSGTISVGIPESGSLRFFMETNWVVSMDMLALLRDRTAPDCRIRYTAEEPLMNYFRSSDPEMKGKYTLFSWDDPEGLPPIAFDRPITKQELCDWLKKAFGEGSFGEHLEKLRGYPLQVGFYEPVPEL